VILSVEIVIAIILFCGTVVTSIMQWIVAKGNRSSSETMKLTNTLTTRLAQLEDQVRQLWEARASDAETIYRQREIMLHQELTIERLQHAQDSARPPPSPSVPGEPPS